MPILLPLLRQPGHRHRLIDVTTASGAVHSVGDMSPRRVARPHGELFTLNWR